MAANGRAKRSILIEILGLPLAVRVDPAGPHDVKSSRALLDEHPMTAPIESARVPSFTPGAPAAKAPGPGGRSATFARDSTMKHCGARSAGASGGDAVIQMAETPRTFTLPPDHCTLLPYASA